MASSCAVGEYVWSMPVIVVEVAAVEVVVVVAVDKIERADMVVAVAVVAMGETEIVSMTVVAAVITVVTAVVIIVVVEVAVVAIVVDTAHQEGTTEIDPLLHEQDDHHEPDPGAGLQDDADDQAKTFLHEHPNTIIIQLINYCQLIM